MELHQLIRDLSLRSLTYHVLAVEPHDERRARVAAVRAAAIMGYVGRDLEQATEEILVGWRAMTRAPVPPIEVVEWGTVYESLGPLA